MINRDRLLDTFLDYVRIDSESTHEGAIAARVAEDLQAIGCQVDLDDTQAQTGSDTGNLYCTLPGTAPGQPILLSAHLDTVIPGTGVEPVLENGVIRSKGDTVLGSDDKAGRGRYRRGPALPGRTAAPPPSSPGGLYRV